MLPWKMVSKQDGSKLSQYIACISASVVLFTIGLHTGWPGPSLRKILSPEYPFHVTEDEASYIAIIGSLGHIMGGILSSTLADVLGRKWTLLCVAFPQALSMILIYFSYLGKPLLYCARIAGGIGEGATLIIYPMYVAEVAEPSIRGILGTFTTTVFVTGALFINIVGSYLDIHTTALIGLAFPILQWLVFHRMPDTPYYLLMKDRGEEARRSLQFLRRRNSVEKEIFGLTADVKRQMSESGTYKDLFVVPSNRKAFMIIIAVRFFQQYTGCTAYGTYYQILIQESTDLSPVMGSSLLLIVQLLMSFLVILFVDRFGRKPILVFSSGTSFLVLFILGTFFVIRDYTTVDVSGLHWLPLVMMALFVIAFGFGLGVVVNIFVSEIFSTSIKARALSLSSVITASTMMSSTKFYQYTADNLGLTVPFYSFAAITFVGTLFFRFVLPETKGKTLETIQQELKGNIKKAEKKSENDTRGL